MKRITEIAIDFLLILYGAVIAGGAVWLACAPRQHPPVVVFCDLPVPTTCSR
jgi:hypothetical protein